MAHIWQIGKASLGLLILLSLVACPTKKAVLGTPTPNPLELSAEVSKSDTGSVSVQNSGDAPLNYTASETAPWLEITSGASGTVVPGASASIDLTATCPATPTDLSATLAISSNGGNKDVTVNLNCTGTPEISDPIPNPLNLSAEVNGSETGSISFQNSGNAQLTYTASESEPWLEITSGVSGTVALGATATIDLTATCPATPDDLTTTLTISSNDADEPTKSVTVNLSCSAVSNFAIEVRFLGSAFTPARQQVFQDAADRWAEVIIGDLSDIPLNKPANNCGAGEPAVNETVDDLLIHAIIEPIDGAGGVLGSAGPCLVRTSGAGLPAYGVMRFDSADVAALEADGSFPGIILHEMGHVLGIGTLWDFYGFLDYTTNPTGQQCNQATNFTVKPTFNGAGAIAEFATLGGSGQPPAEDEFGQGTKCGHWDEGFFDTELMTGFAEATPLLPLSRLTGASLADIGYTVGLTSADPYSIPACSPGCTALRAQDEGRLINEILLYPRGMVTPNGKVVPVSSGSQE